MNPREWPQEHIDELRRLITIRYGSYADIAHFLNRMFGTRHSRNAAIGKAKRIGLCNPQKFGRSIEAINRARERDRNKKQRMRETRWKAKPSLKERYERNLQLKANREKMAAGGASTTSREYRTHMPRLPEMTKNELRAMLKLAVENTAVMECGA